MCNAASLARFQALLAAEPALCARLWIDLPEAAAYNHVGAFRTFCTELKRLGCKIGLEHVGQYVGRIGDLSDVGLDYLKIARSITAASPITVATRLS